MRSLTMLFFAVATFLLGSIAREIARTDDSTYQVVIWVVMLLGIVLFLVAAAIVVRRRSST